MEEILSVVPDKYRGLYIDLQVLIVQNMQYAEKIGSIEESISKDFKKYYIKLYKENLEIIEDLLAIVSKEIN